MASVHLPLIQEHIGDALGLTNIHVNRKSWELREASVCDMLEQSSRSLNPDMLVEAAGYDEVPPELLAA